MLGEALGHLLRGISGIISLFSLAARKLRAEFALRSPRQGSYDQESCI